MRIFSSLINGPIPTILLLAGIFLIALPLVTRFGGNIKITGRRQIFMIGIGILLFLVGIGLYLIPTSTNFIKTDPPTILGVTVRTSQEAGELVYYQEIDFYDEDGNTERGEWELVDLSDPAQRPFINIQNSPVEALPELQKIRATVTQAWNCKGRIYVATVEVSLVDRDSNRSEPVRYKIDCK